MTAVTASELSTSVGPIRDATMSEVDDGRAADQQRAAGGLDRGRGGVRRVMVRDVLLQLRAPAPVEQQAVSDAEREAGHRAEDHVDRVDVLDLAEQRRQPEPRIGRRCGDDRHEARRDRRAQQQHEDEEEDRQRPRHAVARGVDRGRPHRAVDARLARDRRVDGHRWCLGRRAARLPTCPVLTISFSDLATETTIIAAPLRGRSCAPAAPASQADSTRVSGPAGEVTHQRRPLAVELALRTLEQDRHEDARTEVGVGEVLRAGRLGPGDDGDGRRQRAAHAEADQRQGEADRAEVTREASGWRRDRRARRITRDLLHEGETVTATLRPA